MRCKVPGCNARYCSRSCQKNDWKEHRLAWPHRVYSSPPFNIELSFMYLITNKYSSKDKIPESITNNWCSKCCDKTVDDRIQIFFQDSGNYPRHPPHQEFEFGVILFYTSLFPKKQSNDEYLSTLKKSPRGNTCIICHDDIFEGNGVELECKHSYHTSCISTWFDKKRICPYCRRYVPEVSALTKYQYISLPYPSRRVGIYVISFASGEKPHINIEETILSDLL